jgi:DNA modification methylase
MNEFRTAAGTEILLSQADCIECMATLPENSIDLVIADPPYYLKTKENTGTEKFREEKNITKITHDWDQFESIDAYLSFTNLWLSEAMRIIKPSGSVFVFGTYHNFGLISYLVHRKIEAGEALQKRGNWNIINEIIWYKRNAVPNLSCRQFCASNENILWLAKSNKYTFNYKDMKFGDFPDDHLKRPEKQMRSVWDILSANNESVNHPTQNPIKLYERMILAASKEGDLVLDPFAGSGTLAIAATNLNRDSALIEREESYCNLIRKRIRPLLVKPDISIVS